MREEVEARARRLLAAEPTRSMGVGVLRERLLAEMGDRVAAAPQLVRDLGEQPGFMVLDAPVTLVDALELFDTDAGMADRALLARYRAALREVLADSDMRILLTDAPESSPATIFSLVARSIVELARAAPADADLRRAMNAALRDADAVARSISVSADRSTIPPRDPPQPGRIPPRAPRRSSRPLRTGESR